MVKKFGSHNITMKCFIQIRAIKRSVIKGLYCAYFIHSACASSITSEMAHDRINKSILFYSILFYSSLKYPREVITENDDWINKSEGVITVGVSTSSTRPSGIVVFGICRTS